MGCMGVLKSKVKQKMCAGVVFLHSFYGVGGVERERLLWKGNIFKIHQLILLPRP